MDKIALGIFSDFLINLAAGWVGAAVILPTRTERRKARLFLLTFNISLGIVGLMFAYLIRRNI